MLKIALVTMMCILSCSAFGSAMGDSSSGGFKEIEPISTKELIQSWQSFEGKNISAISFKGQVRTRELAMRWLMNTEVGEKFSAKKLARDLQALANTGVLYDIKANVNPSANNSEDVTIEVCLKDKWTLIPIFGAEGGGGSVVYGGGIYDTNIAGFFISGLFLGYNYNGIFSYEVNLSEDYIAGTNVDAAFDWSNNINPTIIHNIDNTSAGQYTWQRQQEETMIGYHFSDYFKFSVVADIFRDALLETKGVNATVYAGDQYRFRPTVVWGRTNIVNDYLEEGSEVRGSFASSNFLGPAPAYQEYKLEFKKVILHGKNNIGFFLGGGAMTSAPAPYEFLVGGYGNLRGFMDSRQIGPYLFHGNLEYRPFIYHKYASGVTRVVLQGNLFTDFGSAWGDSSLVGDSGTRQFNALWSIGAGLRLNLIRFSGAIIRLDAGRTVKPDEGWGFTFGVGQFF